MSWLREEIGDRVNAPLDGSLEDDGPYLWIDAPGVKVRQAGRTVSVVATGAVGRAAVLLDDLRSRFTARLGALLGLARYAFRVVYGL